MRINRLRMALKPFLNRSKMSVSSKNAVSHASRQTIAEEKKQTASQVSKGQKNRPPASHRKAGQAVLAKKGMEKSREREGAKGGDRVSNAPPRKALAPRRRISPKDIGVPNEHPNKRIHKGERAPADTIILTKADGEGAASYAEILRRVHATAKSRKLDVNIVRRTEECSSEWKEGEQGPNQMLFRPK